MRECIKCNTSIPQSELLCRDCKRKMTKQSQKELLTNYSKTSDDTTDVLLALTLLSTFSSDTSYNSSSYGDTTCSGNSYSGSHNYSDSYSSSSSCDSYSSSSSFDSSF